MILELYPLRVAELVSQTCLRAAFRTGWAGWAGWAGLTRGPTVGLKPTATIPGFRPPYLLKLPTGPSVLSAVLGGGKAPCPESRWCQGHPTLQLRKHPET